MLNKDLIKLLQSLPEDLPVSYDEEYHDDHSQIIGLRVQTCVVTDLYAVEKS